MSSSGDEWQELVRRARETFGLDLSPAALDQIRVFVTELGRWAPKSNLISVGSAGEGEIVSRHVLDSLAAVRLLPREGVTADIGSGAGFPGVPLAICRPGPIRLIEARRRRASFLRHVVRVLGLSGVEVFEGRSEDFSERLSAVVSRAVRPEVAIAVGSRLLVPGGRILLFEKQSAPVPEAAGFRSGEHLDYLLPGGLRHRVTVLERFT